MAYTTIENIRERLPIITEAVRSDSVLSDFIAQGDSLVNSYLRKRYALPLETPIDSLIEYVALDLVCGLLLENVFGEDSPNDVRHSAILKGRALRLLEQVASGEILLQHEELSDGVRPRVFRPATTSTAHSDFTLGNDATDLPE